MDSSSTSQQKVYELRCRLQAHDLCARHEVDSPPWMQPRDKWIFFLSTPIQMPPRRGGNSGRMTHDLPSTRLQGGSSTEWFRRSWVAGSRDQKVRRQNTHFPSAGVAQACASASVESATSSMFKIGLYKPLSQLCRQCTPLSWLYRQYTTCSQRWHGPILSGETSFSFI